MKKNVLNQERYDSPEVIVVEMSVENGFAASATGDIDDSTPGGDMNS